MVEKIIFWSQILEVDILMDLHILRSSKSENDIFSGWSEYVCVLKLKNKWQRKLEI